MFSMAYNAFCLIYKVFSIVSSIYSQVSYILQILPAQKNIMCQSLSDE